MDGNYATLMEGGVPSINFMVDLFFGADIFHNSEIKTNTSAVIILASLEEYNLP